MIKRKNEQSTKRNITRKNAMVWKEQEGVGREGTEGEGTKGVKGGGEKGTLQKGKRRRKHV